MTLSERVTKDQRVIVNLALDVDSIMEVCSALASAVNRARQRERELQRVGCLDSEQLAAIRADIIDQLNEQRATNPNLEAEFTEMNAMFLAAAGDDDGN